MANSADQPLLARQKIHFVSLGCAKNRVDTEVLAGIALETGHEIVPDPADAHVIVINTCGFIETAQQESIDTILELARFKERGTCDQLIVAGCLSQRFGATLAEALPEVDDFIATASLESIASIIANPKSRHHFQPAGHHLQRAGTPRFVEPGCVSTYVKIGDGCSRRCAFCVIPSIRGSGRSRPIEQIADEVAALAARGITEINLVAQDTSAFGRDLSPPRSLVELLRALEQVDVQWIRLLYLYPDQVDEELLRQIAGSTKVVPYLDIPIQHASGEVLRAMRRGHGPETLQKLVERARRVIPKVFLRTTVLVGHPGETPRDFERLVEFIEWARFDHLGVFRYSPQEGTASYGMTPAVTPRDSYNRFRRVMAVQRRISKARNRSLIGRELNVLVLESADNQGFVLRGRHAGQAPDIDGVTYLTSCSARPGAIVKATATRAEDHDIVADGDHRSTPARLEPPRTKPCQ